MKLYIRVSGEYRQRRFIEFGEEVGTSVTVTVPVAVLPPAEREILYSLPTAGSPEIHELRLGVRGSCSSSDYYDANPPLLPGENDGDMTKAIWGRLLDGFVTFRAKRTEETAAKKAIELEETVAKRLRQIETARLIIANGAHANPGQPNHPWVSDLCEGLPEDHPVAALAREVAVDLQAAYSAHTEREEAKKAATEALKAEREADKIAWILAHGSEYLQKAHTAGYDCQRKYVEERAALEFPGFVVDFDDNAHWSSRSCPSEPSLNAALAINEAAGDEIAEVVWLTTEPDGTALGTESDDRGEWDTSPLQPRREAIVIRNYLGKYDLVK